MQQDYGVRVHTVRFPADLDPMHIGCTFVVLGPKLAMVNPSRVPMGPRDDVIFQENDWKIIEGPEPSNPIRPAFSQSSKWLNLSILILAEDKVVVKEQE